MVCLSVTFLSVPEGRQALHFQALAGGTAPQMSHTIGQLDPVITPPGLPSKIEDWHSPHLAGFRRVILSCCNYHPVALFIIALVPGSRGSEYVIILLTEHIIALVSLFSYQCP